jgi:anti-sigma factor RsiW
MKPDDKTLRLQAWVDGELGPREAGEVEAWVQSDPEARAFVDDLRHLNAVVQSNEPERAVPETREFYWSMIARGIERQQRETLHESPATPESSVVAWWRHRFVLVGSLAVVALSVLLLWIIPQPGDHAVLAVGHEVDTPIAGVDAFTFRSESERMTVVWVDFDSE